MTNTGNDWMRTTATDELGAIDAEPHITGAVLMSGEHCLEIRNGRYTVDGVVTCLTLQSALGLMQS